MSQTELSNQKPTIGRIVHYRPQYDPTATPTVGGDFHIAAVITMTPEEWTPGYRDPQGEWHETTAVLQPAADTVHLHLFAPPIESGSPAYTSLDLKSVHYGVGPGQWSWPQRV